MIILVPFIIIVRTLTYKKKMTKENKITEKMYEALCKKYESQILESESSLLIYFSSSVGIGEHPQHIEEMDKLVEKMANAKDKLETIKEFYKYN